MRYSVYIAGPMSGLPEFNFPAFKKAAEALRGVFSGEVYSPHETAISSGVSADGETGTGSLSVEAMENIWRDNIAALADSTNMVLLPGWEKSAGTLFELQIADKLGIPCKEIDAVLWHSACHFLTAAELASQPALIRTKEVDKAAETLAAYQDAALDESAPKTARREALEEAANLIDSERNAVYGEPSENFARIAAFWSEQFHRPFTAGDVAAAMALVKLARLSRTPDHRDSWVDLAGYAGIGAELTQAVKP